MLTWQNDNRVIAQRRTAPTTQFEPYFLNKSVSVRDIVGRRGSLGGGWLWSLVCLAESLSFVVLTIVFVLHHLGGPFQ